MSLLARSPALRALAAVLVAFGGFVLLVHATDADAQEDPEVILERARAASGSASFVGLLEIEWRVGDRVLRAEVPARAVDGAVQLGSGDERVGARGPDRWESADGSWRRVWDDREAPAGPRPGAAWELDVADPDEVAGRRALVVTATDPGTGRIRARFFVDTERDVLLRREVLDRRGRLVRAVGFVRLGDAARAAPPHVPDSGGRGPAPEPAADVPDGYRDPDRIVDFELLGRYRHPDGSVQLFYGDGLFHVSVFQEPGDVDWDSLPSGGRDETVEGSRARSYATASGTVVVWGDDGFVLTCVGDAPPDRVWAVVRDLNTAGDGDILDDVADFVLAPFGWD
jgi:hypothetical protein